MSSGKRRKGKEKKKRKKGFMAEFWGGEFRDLNFSIPRGRGKGRGRKGLTGKGGGGRRGAGQFLHSLSIPCRGKGGKTHHPDESLLFFFSCMGRKKRGGEEIGVS